MRSIYSIIKKAKKYLIRNDVIAIPTETVYGIGADATNSIAVQKIYEIRPNYAVLESC